METLFVLVSWIVLVYLVHLVFRATRQIDELHRIIKRWDEVES